MDLPPPDIGEPPDQVPELPPIERNVPDTDYIATLTPPWALPLLRVVRGGKPVTIDAALRKLAKTLPASVPLPSAEEPTALASIGGGMGES